MCQTCGSTPKPTQSPCAAKPRCQTQCQPQSPCGGCTKSYCQGGSTNTCASGPATPHLVVDKVSELNGLCNVIVTVREENAVYHIDGNGNPIAVSRNPVFENNHVPAVGLYKSVQVFDFAANKYYVYNYTGDFRTVEGGLI